MRAHLYTPRDWYVVRGSVQEFACYFCGAPVLSSERAYPEKGRAPEESNEAYCSRTCRDERAARCGVGGSV